MKEFITDFDQLQESMIKCQKNVTWKPSVKSFVLNSEENLHRMEEQLKKWNLEKWEATANSDQISKETGRTKHPVQRSHLSAEHK